jgi:hypothetical protein
MPRPRFAAAAPEDAGRATAPAFLFLVPVPAAWMATPLRASRHCEIHAADTAHIDRHVPGLMRRRERRHG